jgi:hypothetical protein
MAATVEGSFQVGQPEGLPNESDDTAGRCWGGWMWPVRISVGIPLISFKMLDILQIEPI